MNRKQKIIISVTGIFLVLLILVGLTYAYFLTRINGNPNNQSISVTTANLQLDWIDGTDKIIDSTDVIMPGQFESSITFSVKNNGNAIIEDYGLIVDDLRIKWASTVSGTNQVQNVDTYLEHPDDFELTIVCSSDKGSCDGKETYLPTTNEILLTNDITPGETQTYTATLEYIDDGDQSADMNKTITARLDIIDTQNTTVLAGRVSNYTPGDYVQTNSVQRISSIDKNGNYKIVGLEPGNHTVRLYDKSSIEKGSKSISIDKEDNKIEINIDRSTNTYTEGTTKNPYKEGTLAYEIINNAMNATLIDEMVNGEAYYRTKPLTIPEIEINEPTESSLSITSDDHGISYYFRGNVRNNYLNFNEMCWRIVRIEGDGSVKLILEDQYGECDSEDYTGNYNLGYSSFGHKNSDKYFLYRYNYDNELTIENGLELADYENAGQGDLEDNLNTWLSDNFDAKKMDNIKSTKVCLGDTETKYLDGKQLTESDLNKQIEDYKYHTWEYSNSVKDNTLECIEGGLSERTYQIYPLNVNELYYAGLSKNENRNNYIINEYTKTSKSTFWTLNASNMYVGGIDDFYSSSITDNAGDYIFSIDYSGKVNTTDAYGPNGAYMRPSISLIEGIEVGIMSGDGTKNNPYKIKELKSLKTPGMDELELIYEKGMTWKEWSNSDYSKVFKDNWGSNNDNKLIVDFEDDWCTDIEKDEAILAPIYYYIDSTSDKIISEDDSSWYFSEQHIPDECKSTN